MTDFLRRASERVLAGEDNKALSDLRVAEPDLRVSGEIAGLRTLLELARTIRDRNEGRVHDQAEALIREVTPTIAAFAPPKSPPSNAVSTSPASSSLEGWVTFCVAGFAAAAILSVIGGVVAGLDDVQSEGVQLAWILVGLIAASVWVGAAVLLLLVRDIASGIADLVGRRPK